MWIKIDGSTNLVLEMARVGYFFDDKYEVYINTDDPGNEPHFHIRDKGTRGGEFHTCVKINDAMYFRHPGKMDLMNTHMRQALVDFLKAVPAKTKKISFPTNWDKIIYEWNENNSNMKVDEEKPMPDYINIADNLTRLISEGEIEMERKAIADKWIPIGEKEDVIFCEMSSRRKSKTGLPMNIWIDDSKSYIAGKHSKRIKFQLDKGKMNPDNFGTMDLDGVIHKPDHPIKQLHQSDLTQLRNFVRNNKYALERLADIEIDIEDIWPSIIKGGEPATEEEIDALNAKVDELVVIDDD